MLKFSDLSFKLYILLGEVLFVDVYEYMCASGSGRE